MVDASIAGRLLVGGVLASGRVVHAGGRIVRVELDSGSGGTSAAHAPIVAPGLVDLHVHGFRGAEPLGDLARMAEALARAGTTAFLPTLFPRRSLEALGAEAQAVWDAAGGLAERRAPAARVLGVHLEGPFIHPGAVGGLPRDELALPSPKALAALLGPGGGSGGRGARGISTLTLAPELDGAAELIAELRRLGMRASLGHSLANVREARRGIQAGAMGATHLYNAMAPLHHREAGLAGAALLADELFVEIIGDLVHVGREAFEIALGARGPRGLCLVSDALSGPADGEQRFCSHGKQCFVEDGAAWFDDPGAPGRRRLTGTILSQLEALRRLVRAGVATPAEALTMASETPARALGVEAEHGVLAPGARADLLVLSGSDLSLERVLVAGRDALAPAAARR